MRFLRRALLFVPVFALGVVGASLPTVSLGVNSTEFHATLNGYNETPSINTDGFATLKLHLDDATQTISFRLEYSGLSANPAAAHIHLGQQHTAGGVMVFFCGGGGQPACPASTSGVVSGLITPANVVGPAAQGLAPGNMAAVFNAIRSDAAYANMHTSNFPSGEIRGQVKD
ncbi:MAG TPA: CHRD domain-containing protein [Chloroflexota bacterium]|jgi:hypothetical protein